MRSDEARQLADHLRGVRDYLSKTAEWLSQKPLERGIQRLPGQAMSAAHQIDEMILAADRYAVKAAEADKTARAELERDGQRAAYMQRVQEGNP